MSPVRGTCTYYGGIGSYPPRGRRNLRVSMVGMFLLNTNLLEKNQRHLAGI